MAQSPVPTASLLGLRMQVRDGGGHSSKAGASSLQGGYRWARRRPALGAGAGQRYGQGTGSFRASWACQGVLPSHVLLPVLLPKAILLDLVMEKLWTRFKKFLKGPKKRGWGCSDYTFSPLHPPSTPPPSPQTQQGGAVRRAAT